MDEVKPILASKTVRGGLAVVLFQIMHIAGYKISDTDTQAIIEDIATLCTILSGLFTIYGRIKATKILTVKPPAGAVK